MSFSKLTIRDVPIHDRVVLVRVDYNVPLKNGKIGDDLRVRASLPTLRYLQQQGATIVLMSHLGRPDGQVVPALSLEPVARHLETLIKQPVQFVEACYGDKVRQAVKRAKKGDIIMLENLRFYPEETANDETFARRIVKDSSARYLVQDGFGVVHRAHASTEAITQLIPGVAGLLLEREVVELTRTMEKPDRPLVAVMGGVKVSDKIQVIETFVRVADKIIIGGAMANTFLAYKGFDMGKSIVEADQKETLDVIYAAAAKKVGADRVDEFICLPVDVAVCTEVSQKARRKNRTLDKVAADEIAADIGDLTIERYVQLLSDAKTVVWNGTMGLAEMTEFAHGSARVALALASDTTKTSIIGGGDTADFALGWDGQDGKSFTHVSTGGGASLDLMAGKTLPGLEALLDARK